jgi:hypothetical protein
VNGDEKNESRVKKRGESHDEYTKDEFGPRKEVYIDGRTATEPFQIDAWLSSSARQLD